MCCSTLTCLTLSQQAKQLAGPTDVTGLALTVQSYINGSLLASAECIVQQQKHERNMLELSLWRMLCMLVCISTAVHKLLVPTMAEKPECGNDDTA